MENELRVKGPESKVLKTIHFPHIDGKRLSNGITLYRSPSRALGVIRLDIVWPWGSLVQPKKGVARSASSLVLSGSEGFSAEAIQTHFEYLGSSVSVDTGTYQTTLTLRASKEQFEESLLWLLKHWAMPAFPESELITYKQIELAGLQRRMQTPRYWSQRRLYESMWGENHPFASFIDSNDIGLLSSAELKNWYVDSLQLAGTTWLISGDVSDKEEAVIENLSFIKQNGLKDLASIKATGQEVSSGLIKHPLPHSNQVSMSWGKKLPYLGSKELHQIGVLNTLLGGFFGSRLMRIIREELGLTYGIGSGISQTPEGNLLSISGELNADNVELAIQEIKKILKRLREELVGEEELEKVKRYLSGQYRSGFDGPFSMNVRIPQLMVRGLDYGHYDSALDTIWATSPEEICQLADNYLDPESFVIVLSGKV